MRYISTLALVLCLALTLGVTTHPDALHPPQSVSYAQRIEYIPQSSDAPADEYDPRESASEAPKPPPAPEISERDAVLLAKTLYGEYRGGDGTQRAAVCWCVLNRADAWGQSVEEVVTTPNQFLGYSPGNPVLPELYGAAADVLTRHALEKRGEADVGRVLPRGYLWFTGDGVKNHFRDAYKGGNVWEFEEAMP